MRLYINPVSLLYSVQHHGSPAPAHEAVPGPGPGSEPPPGAGAKLYLDCTRQGTTLYLD